MVVTDCKSLEESVWVHESRGRGDITYRLSLDDPPTEDLGHRLGSTYALTYVNFPTSGPSSAAGPAGLREPE